MRKIPDALSWYAAAAAANAATAFIFLFTSDAKNTIGLTLSSSSAF